MRWSERFDPEMELRGLRPTTRETYVLAAAMFFRHCGKPPARVSAEDVRAWQLYLVRAGYAANSISVSAAALRMFFVYTIHRPDVVARVRTMRVDDRFPEILSTDDVAETDRPHARTLKHRAMSMLMHGTGMRTGELSRLRVCDVDSARSIVHLRDTKSRRDRIVPLPNRARDGTRESWKSLRVRPRGEDLLFPGYRSTAGFTRIRHSGLFAARNVPTPLHRARTLLECAASPSAPVQHWTTRLEIMTGFEPLRCGDWPSALSAFVELARGLGVVDERAAKWFDEWRDF